VVSPTITTGSGSLANTDSGPCVGPENRSPPLNTNHGLTTAMLIVSVLTPSARSGLSLQRIRTGLVIVGLTTARRVHRPPRHNSPSRYQRRGSPSRSAQGPLGADPLALTAQHNGYDGPCAPPQRVCQRDRQRHSAFLSDATGGGSAGRPWRTASHATASRTAGLARHPMLREEYWWAASVLRRCVRRQLAGPLRVSHID